MSMSDVQVGARRHSAGGGQQQLEAGRRLAEKERARAAPWRIVLVGFDGVRGVHSQIAQLLAQGSPSDPQQESGPLLAPAGVLQDAGE